jgi:hypothetical protein
VGSESVGVLMSSIPRQNFRQIFSRGDNDYGVVVAEPTIRRD